MGLFDKNKWTIKKEAQRLQDMLHGMDPTDPNYSKINTELEKLTKSDSNSSAAQKMIVAQATGAAVNAVISGGVAMYQMKRMTNYEKAGEIPTSKGFNYIKKP